MEYGEKIAALRKSKGMTQAELGNALNVTYQAVSKWERGESEPDFGTLSKMARIFGVPITYFEDGNMSYSNAQSASSAPTPAMIGVCTGCGKVLYEGDEYITSPKLVCKSCAELTERNRQIAERNRQLEIAAEQRRAANERERLRKEQLGSGFDIKLIISLLLAVAAYILLTVLIFNSDTGDRELLGFIMTLAPLSVFAIVHSIWGFIDDLRDVDGPDGYKLSLSLIVGAGFAVINLILFVILYAVLDKNAFFFGLIFLGTLTSFTFISQYMWGSAVVEIFSCGGLTFKMPGFIFSLTVESILWMIVTKIFLGIISIIVFIVTSILFAVVAIIGSVFLFIPCLISKLVKDKRTV